MSAIERDFYPINGGSHDQHLEGTVIFAGDHCGCVLHLMRHFRRAVSALRADCCSFVTQSVAPIWDPPRFLERVRDVHRRWFCAWRTLWDRVGVLEQETTVRCLANVRFWHKADIRF